MYKPQAALYSIVEAPLQAFGTPNTVPAYEDIETAKDALPAIMEHIARIMDGRDIVVGDYVNEQPFYDDLVAGMHYEGWTIAGSGYYSAAFFKGGLVLKVGIKPEDPGFSYALWCRANQGAEGVPLIHKMQAKGLCYGILMDRLEPLLGAITKGDATYDPALAADYDTVKEAVNLGRKTWGFHPLATTALAIREFFADMAEFDIHEDNVMQDRTGNLIITDPVSFMGDSRSSTIKD